MAKLGEHGLYIVSYLFLLFSGLGMLRLHLGRGMCSSAGGLRSRMRFSELSRVDVATQLFPPKARRSLADDLCLQEDSKHSTSSEGRFRTYLYFSITLQGSSRVVDPRSGPTSQSSTQDIDRGKTNNAAAGACWPVERFPRTTPVPAYSSPVDRDHTSTSTCPCVGKGGRRCKHKLGDFFPTQPPGPDAV